MKQNNILFRMAARCEAAGRPNNEDNYQLDADLSDDQWGFTADEEISLGEKGALLVVCDGMGGMNAGEVASDIAVKTIKQLFASELLTDSVLQNPCKYIADAIIAADSAIKSHSKENPETEGMGSTIVMAWLLGEKVYVGWCGDSRCYRFNPQLGLERLSHDHSYVQELVDAGKLTEELAFDHPNNNIITRSLGDPRGAAQPDTKEFDLYNNDIILLCSDGLCGTLRDNEIEELVQQHQTSMQECRDALWVADEAAGWTDNVTIALAQIIGGAKVLTDTIKSTTIAGNMSTSKANLIAANKRLKRILFCVIMLLFLCAIIVISYRYKDKFISFFTNEQLVIEQIDEVYQMHDETVDTTFNVQNTDSVNKEHKSVPNKTLLINKTLEQGNDADGKSVVVQQENNVKTTNDALQQDTSTITTPEVQLVNENSVKTQ